MKSLQALKQESASIQSEIGKLLLDRSRFDHEMKKPTDLTETVTTLRQNLDAIQRELRERLSA